MNNTIAKIVGVFFGLIIIALLVTYNQVFLNNCQNECDFDGYECFGDMSALCIDVDGNGCKDYIGNLCFLGCNQETGICEPD